MKNDLLPCVPVADIELPQPVRRLYDLAYNLWWSWNEGAQALFSRIDGEQWARYRNPVALLINVEPNRWDPLLNDDFFMDQYHQVIARFDQYLSREHSPWFDRNYEGTKETVAYFSMEYGIDACLPLYSGGLGVLSGDHLKSASDLGLPLVGVGLLYRRGYFRQTVDAEGLQQHYYPSYDFNTLPLRPVAMYNGTPLVIGVPFPGRTVWAQVWLAEVGRIPLLLLDTDIPKNDSADRPISGILYVGGRSMRFEQELLLGAGGYRALKALQIEPSTYHLNEGHCALLQIERLVSLLEDGHSFDDSLHEIKKSTVFTTHTPVPAGNERFHPSLAHRYFELWSARDGIDSEKLFSLGRMDGDDHLNLTALALRTSRWANGVSAIHGQVSRGMWRSLFGEEEAESVPITHVTNGVHVPTWLGKEYRDLLYDQLGKRWWEQSPEDFHQRVEAIPDLLIWRAHLAQKKRLGRFIRNRTRQAAARHGRSSDELRRLADFFQPESLTLGFARRFATYKRARLLFSDAERVQRIFGAKDRQVQIVLAGKAHPADRPGQDLIRHLYELSQSDTFGGQVFFLEDYDIRIGKMLVQGVDVWLNNPRKPKEASGTSGQKAAMNGALNFSILDGWWPEAFDEFNGWAIRGGDHQDQDHQDREDAAAMYRILEDEIIPEFYDSDGPLPKKWVARMKRSIATVVPRYSSDRMVRDYSTEGYFPKD